LVHCIEENHNLVLVPVQAGFPNNSIRRSRSTNLIRVSQIPKHPVLGVFKGI
jgi:hypothetical protein